MTFMQFQPITAGPVAAPLPLPKAAPKGQPTPKTQSAAAKAMQNLLVHIPGEASGFYLFGIEMLAGPGEATPPTSAAVVGVLALVLLVVVRWLAAASMAVMVTSIAAFLLWMAVFDNGFLTLLGWGIPNPLGVIVAAFYSTLVTVLGSAGKLK